MVYYVMSYRLVSKWQAFSVLYLVHYCLVDFDIFRTKCIYWFYLSLYYIAYGLLSYQQQTHIKVKSAAATFASSLFLIPYSTSIVLRLNGYNAVMYSYMIWIIVYCAMNSKFKVERAAITLFSVPDSSLNNELVDIASIITFILLYLIDDLWSAINLCCDNLWPNPFAL